MSNDDVYAGGLLNRALDPATRTGGRADGRTGVAESLRGSGATEAISQLGGRGIASAPGRLAMTSVNDRLYRLTAALSTAALSAEAG